MPSKGLLWGLAYAAFSMTSFSVSVYMSVSRSYDFFTLMQELTDSFRLTILLNFIVFCFLTFGFVSIRVLFSHIRIIEIEHIADQLPFYGLNLLFILFNDNNLLLNVVWAGLTVIGKVYHIITYDRIDLLQVQVVNRMSSSQQSKIRVLTSFLLNGHVILLSVLLVCDMVLARVLAYDVFQGVSSMGSLLFGIQFGVMGIDCFAYLGKLTLNVYELVFYRCAETNDDLVDDDDDLEEHIWEHRAIYMHSFEIFTSVLKSSFYSLLIYTLFFHSNVALPIPLMQGCLFSLISAGKQIVQFANFLMQSRHLESQLASPTEEDLAAADHLCIICREDMHFPATFSNTRGKALNPRKHPKKLNCGHILHLCCLRDWLERSDSCPLCRKVVFKESEQTRPPTQPANAAPVDRPAAPAAGPTSGPESAPTQTTSEGIDISQSGLPTTTVSASATTAESPQLFPVARTITAGSNYPTPQRTEPSVPRFFIPRDWASFPITATAEPDRFTVMLSATQNAQLTVRRRNT
ncbi:hypothetical protein OXX69_006673 [Metschnikowia pulcherrima]